MTSFDLLGGHIWNLRLLLLVLVLGSQILRVANDRLSELLVVTHVDPRDHETISVQVREERLYIVDEHLTSMVSILL